MAVKRVMLIDDEPAAISNLRSVIDSFAELQVIAEIGDGKTAIREITEQKPDIVFLDIEMPEVNGFEVASATAQENYQLVFVTAYDQYALDAFGTHAIDYLLKPVRPSLLEKCIKKILHQKELVLEALAKQKTQSDSLALSDGNAIRVLNQQHICYIEGIGRYRRIHLTPSGAELHRMQTIVSDTTLDEFQSQLSECNFNRLHRSYIVNLQQVIRLSVESRRHFVILVDTNSKIPVSRNKVSEVKALL
jgi:DNA-binding LytR/AlgR family response regulator